MVNVDYLVLAVSNLYKGSNDFEKICVWLGLYTLQQNKTFFKRYSINRLLNHIFM